ncbi:MAG: prepilin-type N-terminal cleavage/methylation domain-containing protein [Planctomycetes bacterium]|nr:prepilin-type N-terminal cleavage/methylation domain-containing protein [Planctomycetota bacterium]
MTHKSLQKNHSFTIVEILVAVTIIAILAGIYISINVSTRQEKALTTALLLKLELALEEYKNVNGGYPTPDMTGTYPRLKITWLQGHGDFSPDDINPENGSLFFSDYFTEKNGTPKELRYVPYNLYYDNNYKNYVELGVNMKSFQIISAGPDGDFGKDSDNVVNY